MSDRRPIEEFVNALESARVERESQGTWVHRGLYSGDAIYDKGNVVQCGTNAYLSLEFRPGPCPGPDWQLLVEGTKGDQGERGYQGVQGKMGQIGPPGVMGAPGRSIRWRGKYAPFTLYNIDDVVHYDNALWIALQPTEAGPKADQINWDLVIRFFVPNLDSALKAIEAMEDQLNDHSAQHDKPGGSDTIPTMMYMVAPYVANMAVKQGAVARDGDWLMHANKDTDARAAPQPTGEPTFQYGGVDPTTQDTVKQIVSGQRYTTIQAGFVAAYRTYATAGQSYTVYSIRDPLGARVIETAAAFTAASTGWIASGASGAGLAVGEVFDLVQIAREAAPTPVTWSGNWSYTTPKNDEPPGPGEVVQSDNDSGLFHVHKTDDDGGDRSTELEALTIGDQIHSPLVSWAIQTTTDNGGYMTFGVSPAVQSADGVQNFDFDTLTATPITYLEDTDYWPAPAVDAFTIRGLLAVDGGLSDVVEDDNAYGTDIQFQDATVSDDWDIMSYSG